MFVQSTNVCVFRFARKTSFRRHCERCQWYSRWKVEECIQGSNVVPCDQNQSANLNLYQYKWTPACKPRWDPREWQYMLLSNSQWVVDKRAQVVVIDPNAPLHVPWQGVVVCVKDQREWPSTSPLQGYYISSRHDYVRLHYHRGIVHLGHMNATIQKGKQHCALASNAVRWLSWLPVEYLILCKYCASNSWHPTEMRLIYANWRWAAPVLQLACCIAQHSERVSQ